MKKFFAIFLIVGFLFPALPIGAQDGKKKKDETETLAKPGLKRKKNKNMADSTSISDLSETQAAEQRKKEIEAKEKSIDKKKKVKRLTVDENLSKTITNRNIP